MSDLLIKNLSRFVTLEPHEVQAILELFTSRKFRKHQYIAQEGDFVRHENFIVKGLTRTYEVDEKGQEHITQFGIEDWWIGDIYAFLTQTPTRINIDCLEDTEVMQITRANQELLFERVPKMERHFRIMIQNAYVASISRISSTLTKSAAQRYEEFKDRYPHIEQRVPNHQVASYLGITPQSLSRIRSKSNSSKKLP
jgi:CRP-like cAMP-binding protein